MMKINIQKGLDVLVSQLPSFESLKLAHNGITHLRSR